MTKVPVGTAQLVNQAIAAGKLSPEQGLVYRAFAAFGDRRLPAAYAGDDTAHEDTVMREVAESWSKLSSAQRRQVEPFFTPPAARGAAASASAGTAPGATAGLPDQPVRPPRMAVGRGRRWPCPDLVARRPTRRGSRRGRERCSRRPTTRSGASCGPCSAATPSPTSMRTASTAATTSSTSTWSTARTAPRRARRSPIRGRAPRPRRTSSSTPGRSCPPAGSWPTS